MNKIFFVMGGDFLKALKGTTTVVIFRFGLFGHVFQIKLYCC